MSKTTFKLTAAYSDQAGRPELDSAGEEAGPLELMEVPLSPTHYSGPPTPDHAPPSAWQAECAISSMVAMLRSRAGPPTRQVETETEPWLLLPLDWTPSSHTAPQETAERGTNTRPDRVPAGRALPDLPAAERNGGEIESEGESEDSEVVLRRGGGGSIYQTIGGEAESDSEDSSAANRISRGSDKSQQSLYILSPFDEQEEWSKISQIIDSFGADIGQGVAETNGKEAATPNNSPIYDYPTLKRREKLAGTVEEWLRYINMERYLTNFEGSGYDDIDFLGGGVLSREDLVEIGVTDCKDCAVLIESLKDRENMFEFAGPGKPTKGVAGLGLETWLAKLRLQRYTKNFIENMVEDMERVVNIWDEELLTVLEIDRVGHRRRLLLSVAGQAGLPDRLSKVKQVDTTQFDLSLSNSKDNSLLSASSTTSEEGSQTVTTTLGRRKKRAPAPPAVTSPAPAPAPAPAPPTAAGPTSPSTRAGSTGTVRRGRERVEPGGELVQSAVTFKTNYHGNSLVKEFNGIESTREAIEKVKNCQDIIARNGMKVTMFITGSQVQIARLNGGEQVQKHGVGQISCIVYDTDNMCMFGYITSETEQLTRHTHVFSAENRETASEILTAICNGYKETVGRTVEREGRRGRAAKRASQSESDKVGANTRELKAMLICVAGSGRAGRQRAETFPLRPARHTDEELLPGNQQLQGMQIRFVICCFPGWGPVRLRPLLLDKFEGGRERGEAGGQAEARRQHGQPDRQHRHRGQLPHHRGRKLHCSAQSDPKISVLWTTEPYLNFRRIQRRNVLLSKISRVWCRVCPCPGREAGTARKSKSPAFSFGSGYEF